jgi:hypothetical protein
VKAYESHGHAVARKRTPTYLVWCNMISRCTNSKRPDYASYGGRGITVCKEWLASFNAFLADMGERPDSTSLDRVDNAKGYAPGNCRWATKHEQMQNTRATRLLTFRGESMGLNAWAKRLGMNKESLRVRLAKWPLERAMTQPKKGARHVG